MNPVIEITAEVLEVFLQETEERLRLLDDGIVRLEREPSDSELLQEILRAAHSLKGSSAMLGHSQMAELAREMENLVNGLVRGALTVNAEVIDALLSSLDALMALKEELASHQGGDADMGEVLAALTHAPGDGIGLPLMDSEAPLKPLSTPNRNGTEKQKPVPESRRRAFQIDMTLSKDTIWGAVRCFQIMRELAEFGQVISSTPSQEAIENQQVGSNLRVVFIGQQDEEALRRAVVSVEEVETVELMPL